MAYKEIVSLDADVTISLGGRNKKTGKENPKQVEGFYLGTRQVESKKSKNGLAAIHFFQTAKGNIGVWGKTDMDRKLATATQGAMTLVEFDKMVPTPNGEMYKYAVKQDTDNTIEVNLAPVAQQQDDTTEDTAEAAYESSEDDASEDDDQDAALQAAELAAARAASRAKVQNLLKKKSS